MERHNSCLVTEEQRKNKKIKKQNERGYTTKTFQRKP